MKRTGLNQINRLRKSISLLPLFFIFLVTLNLTQVWARQKVCLSAEWKFYRGDVSGAEQIGFNDDSWETVCLPHTVKLESAVSHNDYDYYHGYCWYRKKFKGDAKWQGKKVFIEFEAAMQASEVWVNGKKKKTFLGGYSPFRIDVTYDIDYNDINVVAVRLNNNANPDVPPGNAKPDFYYYGGLYRYVNLHILSPVYISDAVNANRIAGGGVFVTYPQASRSAATVSVKTHVVNEDSNERNCELKTSILEMSGSPVENTTTTISIPAGPSGNDTTFSQKLTVSSPKLWHPDSPNLYRLQSMVYDKDDGKLIDSLETIIGIRKISFSRDKGMQVNGKTIKTVGVNRHQDYGCIGNAVPISGHYRDALLLKTAGVNFVRLSHYIQHPAFLAACDKYGITVQACMPGWQHQGYNNKKWVENAMRDLRTMIRYYRNHPCVVMWEAVHNESKPPKDFTERAQAIAHEEFPGDQMFTVGQEGNKILDIYQAAVQQGGRKYKTHKPQGISEYGHWEYGGFQGSSNQPRSSGEKGMATLAANQTDAMKKNHNLDWLAFDGVWVWNDYFGFAQYKNSLCSGGVVDMFRIPKFSYYFFQSQRDPNHLINDVDSGPMVFIASHWTSKSILDSLRVYSNCEEVALYLNGDLIGKQKPDNIASINHPPFTFKLSSFKAGTLRAEGFIGGSVKARYEVTTPERASKVALFIDTAERKLLADGSDLALVYASITDKNGTIVPGANNAVTFSVSGPGKIISGDGNPVKAVAGIACVYVQTKYNNHGDITVTAKADNLKTGEAKVKSWPISEPTGIHIPMNISHKQFQVQMFQYGTRILLPLPHEIKAKPKNLAKFSLFNVQGKLVRIWTLGKNKDFLVSVKDLAPGLYLGQVRLGTKVYNQKLITIPR